MLRSIYRSIAALLAAGAIWGGMAGAAPVDTPVPPSPPAGHSAAMPQQEAKFIALFEKAQNLYAAAKSSPARQSARIGMQIDLHEFLGLTHDARDWIGTFYEGDTSPDGNHSIVIEIAPNVLISTWTNDYDEVRFRTMIRPYSPFAPVVKDLQIGQPVKFSATLLGSVVSTDDDMVLRPRVIAQFERLEQLSEPPQ